MARARTREARAGDALAEGESALREADRAAREAGREASEAREARGRLEGLAEAAEGHLAEAAEAIEAELGESAEALAERLGPEAAAADPKAAETEVQKLRRQRDALGAVNLRAEEDAREVEAERDRLLGEKADLEGAVERLRAGIRELNREGRQRLTGAFEEVNRRFAELFRHLFGGGEARLVMVESEDPLEAGLEILCQPPGKKLATLSLLSGGEQTLTALSLILAVFLTNPAPICVLDEVDAPLDDSNVVRFCNLLDRMVEATETRFLIITHNPITMSRMDRLFGVTMVEQGVSQLVSVDLSRAREMAGE
jgi:chromosome segregation protein